MQTNMTSQNLIKILNDLIVGKGFVKCLGKQTKIVHASQTSTKAMKRQGNANGKKA